MVRLIAALFLATAPAAAAAGPVLPHPQGLPGIVRISTSPEAGGNPSYDEVDAEWLLADDDEAALDERVDDRRAYFIEHFRVEADGADCSYFKSRPHTEDVTLRTSFLCHRAPGVLTIRSSLLLDLDRAYRTLVVVERPDGQVERRFLGSDATTATVALRGEIDRAAEVANQPVDKLPTLERRVVGLLDGPLTAGALLAGLAGAVVVGAVHALSPGHGKSVAAAYLVGSRGRPRQALALGGIVAAMHSGSVVALGLATWFATSRVDPGRVLDALRAGTAVFVLAIGVYLVVTRTRHRRQHAHGHEHTHSHDAEPFSRKGIVALGLSGGLLPSPSALVVLLAGLSAGRVVLALSLVAAFSLGLAGAVALAGLAVLKGRDLVEVRAASWLPLLAAYGILAAGVVLTVTALT